MRKKKHSRKFDKDWKTFNVTGSPWTPNVQCLRRLRNERYAISSTFESCIFPHKQEDMQGLLCKNKAYDYSVCEAAWWIPFAYTKHNGGEYKTEHISR